MCWRGATWPVHGITLQQKPCRRCCTVHQLANSTRMIHRHVQERENLPPAKSEVTNKGGVALGPIGLSFGTEFADGAQR